MGKRHCSLCDVTHGWNWSEKPESKECRLRLKVPFDLLHRNNKLPNDYKGPLPVVLGELEDGEIITILSPEKLETCKGKPEEMYKLIDEKLKEEEEGKKVETK